MKKNTSEQVFNLMKNSSLEEMSEIGVAGKNIEVSDYNINSDYHDEIRDLLTPPTSLLNTQHSNQKIVILYVIGIFLGIVLVIAMGYFLKLNYKSWLPKRRRFCDFGDCFRQSSGKKRKFFQRNIHKTNFTIPVVIVSDENGQYLDPEGFSDDFEIKTAQAFP